MSLLTCDGVVTETKVLWPLSMLLLMFLFLPGYTLSKKNIAAAGVSGFAQCVMVLITYQSHGSYKLIF
jgi:hypothetical protein